MTWLVHIWRASRADEVRRYINSALRNINLLIICELYIALEHDFSAPDAHPDTLLRPTEATAARRFCHIGAIVALLGPVGMKSLTC